MGLAESPRYFQQLITTVTKGLQFQQCLCYFDDIPVMGVTFKDFLNNLKLVLQRLVNVGLKAKTEKVLLGVCELKFLSFIVSGSRVKSDPNKIKLLQDLPYPRNLKQLQSLLGSFNYFNHFIKDYALLVAPLYRLTRKQRKFEITDADKTIIDELKKKLLTQVELVHYNPLKEIKLSVDASYYAI